MDIVITKYEEEKAGVYQNGNLRAFDLVPEEKGSDMIFHYVKVNPSAITEPEQNDVEKTFLILAGEAVVKCEGTARQIGRGDAVWLPKGSVHVIENGAWELEFIVVKKRGN